MRSVGLILYAFVLSSLVIAGMSLLAERIGLTDRPGGHKRHGHSVPLVGGIGIYAAVASILIVAAWRHPDQGALIHSLLAASTLIFVVGLLDDIHPLGVRVRFGTQAIAASITALWGGLLLTQIGELLPSREVGLNILAFPLTLFAVAGVINSMNLIDGIDGLSGSLSLITLVFLAIIASTSANAQVYLLLALALIGATGGFLLFNFRCCRRSHAWVFLGDSGSTLLGFLFACLFIGMTQTPVRAMPPVITLWLFAIPLFDTVATMLRRVWLGKSPFRADRTHFHHLLLDAGFSVKQSVAVLATVHLLMGLAGLAGWYFRVPDSAMFSAYLLLFAIYFLISSRPWRLVPALRSIHRALDLPLSDVSEIFIGDLPGGDPENVLRKLLGPRADACEYRLYAYENGMSGRRTIYAVVPAGYPKQALRMIRDIKSRLANGEEIIVRQYVPRDQENDRRYDDHRVVRDRRQIDRRGGARKRLDRREGRSAKIDRPGSSLAVDDTAGGVDRVALPAAVSADTSPAKAISMEAS